MEITAAAASGAAEQAQQMLDAAGSAVTGLLGARWWQMQPGELLALGQQLQQLSNVAYTVAVHLAGELDTRRVATDRYGCTSTAALLRQSLLISPAEANGRVNAARKVLPRETSGGVVLPPVLAVLGDAMAAGDVNSEQVKLIGVTVSKLPAALPADQVDFWEAFLVDKASVLDPSPLERVCRSVLDKADPDGELGESSSAAKMEFSFGGRNLRTGLTPIKGQLDDESVEVIKKAIDGLSAPHPASTSPGTGAATHTNGGRGTATHTLMGTGGSTGTHTDTDTHAGAAESTGTNTGTNTTESADTHADAGADAHCGTPVRDPRSPANRRAHALVQAVRGFLDAGLGPTQGGERPHITMVMHWDVVKQALSGAGYDTGGSISPARARRYLCDAQLIPAIMGSDGEILDIGRGSRTFPRAIRRAITLRDQGCVWPGCDRPPGWCDCHHLSWWHRDGGHTSYHGGVLLCPAHHTEIHKGQWTLQMGADGTPELIPPKWIDHQQKPRRNNMHQPMNA